MKQFPGKPKGGQFQSLLFSLILQPVRINKPGAPLLGLAKSIYYLLFCPERTCMALDFKKVLVKIISIIASFADISLAVSMRLYETSQMEGYLQFIYDTLSLAHVPVIVAPGNASAAE